MTDSLQKHGKLQKNRKESAMHGAHRYKTMYLASLDVKTVVDVASRLYCRDSEGDGSVRLDYCCVGGGEEEPQGRGRFRVVRDRIQMLTMCQAGKFKGTYSVDEVGEVLWNAEEQTGGPWCWAVVRSRQGQGIPDVQCLVGGTTFGP